MKIFAKVIGIKVNLRKMFLAVTYLLVLCMTFFGVNAEITVDRVERKRKACCADPT